MSPWLIVATILLPTILALLWRFAVAAFVGSLVLVLVLSPILVPMWLYSAAMHPSLTLSEAGSLAFSNFSADSGECLSPRHNFRDTAAQCFDKLARTYCDTEACLHDMETKLCTEDSCRQGVNLRRIAMDTTEAQPKIDEANCKTSRGGSKAGSVGCIIAAAKEACKTSECAKELAIGECRSLNDADALDCYQRLGVGYHER